MNINWTVRFKNPMFWVGVLVSIVAPVLAYFGLTANDLTSWSMIADIALKAISNPYVLLTVVVSLYNAIVDPTTTGITDSARALQYSYPNSIKE